jgi:hypothetical protein
MQPNAVLCLNCGFNLSTGKKSKIVVAKARKENTATATPIVKEVGIFGIGFGLLLIVLGIFGVVGTEGRRQDVPSSFFTLAALIIFIIPGIMNFAGGILILSMRSKVGILLCMAGSIMLSVLLLGTMSLGGMGFSCMTVLLVAIPILVCLRSAKAMEELKASR